MRSRTSEGLERRVLQPLHTTSCPFLNPPTAEKFIFWCESVLVCQVKYGEFTPDRRLRYPIFVALRRDAIPAECVVENAPAWLGLMGTPERDSW